MTLGGFGYPDWQRYGNQQRILTAGQALVPAFGSKIVFDGSVSNFGSVRIYVAPVTEGVQVSVVQTAHLGAGSLSFSNNYDMRAGDNSDIIIPALGDELIVTVNNPTGTDTQADAAVMGVNLASGSGLSVFKGPLGFADSVSLAANSNLVVPITQHWLGQAQFALQVFGGAADFEVVIYGVDYSGAVVSRLYDQAGFTSDLLIPLSLVNEPIAIQFFNRNGASARTYSWRLAPSL